MRFVWKNCSTYKNKYTTSAPCQTSVTIWTMQSYRRVQGIGNYWRRSSPVRTSMNGCKITYKCLRLGRSRRMKKRWRRWNCMRNFWWNNVHLRRTRQRKNKAILILRLPKVSKNLLKSFRSSRMNLNSWKERSLSQRGLQEDSLAQCLRWVTILSIDSLQQRVLIQA